MAEKDAGQPHLRPFRAQPLIRGVDGHSAINGYTWTSHKWAVYWCNHILRVAATINLLRASIDKSADRVKDCLKRMQVNLIRGSLERLTHDAIDTRSE